MKAVLTLVGIVLLAASVFAVSPVTMDRPPSREFNPLDQQWGPDAFGYRAKDSNEPGGPAFQWFDIETTGTPVSGLGDDNIVGPFQIGWDFHYYWYDVDHFWVGSNGYIRFSSAGMIASPFYQFPYSTYTDVLGVWIGDWFFGPSDPSMCRYWSNNTDTLIVMFKNVRAWAPGGNLGDHDFEIILSGVDSSITYMYGQSTTGDLYNGAQSRGFENITYSPTLGLNLGFNTYPASNYAIKIEYPDVVTYAVNDLGVRAVQNERSAGFFLLTNQSLVPWMSVRNSGNQNESSYIARYSIRNAANNALVVSDDTTMGAIPASDIQDITFPPLWTPTAAGVFRAVGRVQLTGDDYVGNDSLRAEVHVLSLPGELFYDDGTQDDEVSWVGGNGGLANEFVPPVYPVEITQVRYWVVAAGAFSAQILDDGGIGEPGSVLWSQDVPNPTPGGWTTINVDPPVVITEGAFYVAWMMNTTTVSLGLDNASTLGYSLRTWENTGVWALYREADAADAMIRATIGFAGNQPPVITAYSPPNADTLQYELNSTQPFSITASDPDQDPLEYLWTLNGTSVGTTAAVNITFTTLGINRVRALVTDGVDADSVNWVVIVGGTSAGDPGATLPDRFALHAAYPNPFNPSTAIRYDVAQVGNVTLRVFNLAGELVTTLVNGQMEPGRYAVEWNAVSQPSGTYFVTLDAGGLHQTQKLLLLK